MAEYFLKASKREITGKKVKALRRQGIMPAVVYGRDMDPLPVSLDYRDANRILRHLSSTALVTLDVDGSKYTTIVRDKQYDVLLGTILHVDFQSVSMKEKLTTEVSIRLVGEAPVIKNYDSMLISETETLTVEALPQELPDTIELDVSALTDLGDSIYVRDIDLGDKVTILNDPDDVIVVAISLSRAEEEKGEDVDVTDLEAEPEIIQKGKKEEEEEEE